MTQALRLLFDDCLSKHAIAALLRLAEFSRSPVEVAHLATINLEGCCDDDWVPRIAHEGYVVISTDRGKKISRGAKLPILCRRHKVTHVLLTGAVHQLNQFDKLRAIFCVWPLIVSAAESPRGSGYLLKKTNSGGFDLIPIQPPDEDLEVPKVQQTMLANDNAEKQID